MSRASFNKLNEELGRVWEKIIKEASEHPNIVIYSDDKWAETLGSIIEVSDAKISYIRKQLRKAAELFPKRKK